MNIYDGNGAAVELGTQTIESILNGADVVVFGDSNAYYSYGNSRAQHGSFFNLLSKEFDINSWDISQTQPGRNCWQIWCKFRDWISGGDRSAYKKANTIFLFVGGGNDTLQNMSAEYDGNANHTISTNGIYFIAQNCAQHFPLAQWHWVLPTQMDWSVFAGDSGIDFSDRDIDPKLPYLIQHLEKNAFPYCDMYHLSGVQASMLSDGVHLGGGGYNFDTVATKKYYRALRRYLISI